MGKIFDLIKDKEGKWSDTLSGFKAEEVTAEETEQLPEWIPVSEEKFCRAMELHSYFNENVMSALAILKEHLPKKEQDRFQKLIDEMIEWQLEKDKICGVEY